ncbi:protein eva-1 homolog C isoform X3 [Anguilla anguilla]|uniref:protein eva-1 homolog C isoform X3 n=2 Tax=Anguilla anguilla TaxID=7936 RepID=UPI0015AD766D|nr:protein eva-1 homolog C isoform X3 [Anguilla anguilla]
MLLPANPTQATMRCEGYLSKVLRNYTEQACDGEYFSVHCPPSTTISIQSSFYGRRGSAPQHCLPHHSNPSTQLLGDDRHCFVSTSLQKMLDECQDKRSCQVLVNSRLFGTDPCPGRSKYLIVWYKCRPNKYKSKVVCEGDWLRLNCKQSMRIAIYSAIFGRSQPGALECPPYDQKAPAVECQSMGALQVLTSRCQGQRSCSVHATTQEFGDPCYSGTRKYLRVIYTCVPKKLLKEASTKQAVYPLPPSLHDPNVVGDSALPEGSTLVTSDSLPGKKKRGRESGLYSLEDKAFPEGTYDGPLWTLRPPVDAQAVNVEMALISNALAAYNFIAEHPERAALYFVCGVCLGLLLTLFALVVQISCRTDCQAKPHRKRGARGRGAESASDSSDDSDSSDWDTTSDLSARRHRRFERTLHTNVFTSAEELERAQRLEERERIIREIWMNGQPDVPGTRSLNRYY